MDTSLIKEERLSSVDDRICFISDAGWESYGV